MAEPLLEAPGSSDRDFDLASFLNNCLTEDLSASNPPYLLARALWVASRCALQTCLNMIGILRAGPRSLRPHAGARSIPAEMTLQHDLSTPNLTDSLGLET